MRMKLDKIKKVDFWAGRVLVCLVVSHNISDMAKFPVGQMRHLDVAGQKLPRDIVSLIQEAAQYLPNGCSRKMPP